MNQNVTKGHHKELNKTSVINMGQQLIKYIMKHQNKSIKTQNKGNQTHFYHE